MSGAENALDIDPAKLAAEADAVPLPEAEPTAAPGPADQPPPAPGASWAPVTPGLVAVVDLFVCPAWKLDDAEKAALADALAPALDQLFPGGIGDERWAPWFRVLAVTIAITVKRYDRDTAKLAPLREKKEPKPDGEGAPMGPAQTGAGFTTGAGAST